MWREGGGVRIDVTNWKRMREKTVQIDKVGREGIEESYLLLFTLLFLHASFVLFFFSFLLLVLFLILLLLLIFICNLFLHVLILLSCLQSVFFSSTSTPSSFPFSCSPSPPFSPFFSCLCLSFFPAFFFLYVFLLCLSLSESSAPFSFYFPMISSHSMNIRGGGGGQNFYVFNNG